MYPVGATVPGGAPSAFTFSIKTEKSRENGQGLTLPGSKSGNTVVEGQGEFVPYIAEEDEEEEVPSLPPRQPSLAGHRDSHKPPMPTPRHSLLNHKESDEQFEGIDDSNMTTVTDIADQSSFLDRTLSPSPVEEDKQGSLTSLDNQPSVNLNTTSQTLTSIDTPLKTSLQGLTNSSTLDTPEREMLRNPNIDE